MALVPRGAGRVILPATVYGAYNAYNNVRPHFRTLYNMAKRTYRQAFGSRPSTRFKRSRYMKRRPMRRIRRFKRTVRKSQFRRFRNKGRRTYANRTMILRSNFHTRVEFEVDSEGDLKPQLIDINSTTKWIPNAGQTDELQRAKFDNAQCKRLSSVHVYLKNIKYAEQRPQIQVSVPGDTQAYTYSDTNNAQHDIAQFNNHFMIGNGMKFNLRRLQCNYHSTVKASVFSRKFTTHRLDQLNTLSWTDFLNESEVLDRTSGTATQPKLNINFVICPEQLTCLLEGVQACMKMECIVATKWRLYGSKQHN